MADKKKTEKRKIRTKKTGYACKIRIKMVMAKNWNVKKNSKKVTVIFRLENYICTNMKQIFKPQ